MINVYISKSNEASMDDLLHVRTVIKKYPDLHILEHSGGTYRPSLVNEASCIIVVPELRSEKPMLVGKGIYGEAGAADCKHTVVYTGNGRIKKLLARELDDSTNWKKYGTLITTVNDHSLEELCETVLKGNGLPVRILGEHKGVPADSLPKAITREEHAAMNIARNSMYGTNYNHLIEE